MSCARKVSLCVCCRRGPYIFAIRHRILLNHLMLLTVGRKTGSPGKPAGIRARLLPFADALHRAGARPSPPGPRPRVGHVRLGYTREVPSVLQPNMNMLHIPPIMTSPQPIRWVTSRFLTSHLSDLSAGCLLIVRANGQMHCAQAPASPFPCQKSRHQRPDCIAHIKTNTAQLNPSGRLATDLPANVHGGLLSRQNLPIKTRQNREPPCRYKLANKQL
jgi:hypothetical protein